MPLSLWGLDDARKTLNDRLDKSGSAAWKSIRGKPVNDNDPNIRNRPGPPRRASTTTTASSSSTATASALVPPATRDFAPPPRKVSQDVQAVPPSSTTVSSYSDAKNKKPPPPLPSREPSITTPPLPHRSTTSVISPESSGSSSVRPSDMFNRAPSLPASVKRNENQDGVTNELAERLAKMRMKHSQSEEEATSVGSSNVPGSISPNRQGPARSAARAPPPKPVPATSTKTLSSNTAPPPRMNTKPMPTVKPTLPPRTTPIPPAISGLKPPAHSRKPPHPLPYKTSSLHQNVLPEFIYPQPEASPCPGLRTFDSVFSRPTWEMEQASLFVLDTLYPSDATYTFTPKVVEGPVSLIMRDMAGAAHAENSSVIISAGRKRQFKWRSNLIFSVGNLSNLTKDRSDAEFVEEVRGVMIHELTHSWQWSCQNTPSGLIEGIYPLPVVRRDD